ncbi:stage II sporulation protein P [Brevibacillus reuszeri]|uniref:Stage II sporulation protein P n=1 Tax=Brevibacillus reuszeri TaxID=54915 RepID=A0A0K9YZF2_9BACL|nr:stage II sporulation protein P [Brevibacillus reuszeri]KNB74036.1 stage II sporulation protein P [Brevibacillus reuszeri]MED1859789.1 stage II sporulation protein P [Brevibacillus reuszeri]GED72417.1 stage II sporulation protein P [Brevibacillus reuszeri]
MATLIQRQFVVLSFITAVLFVLTGVLSLGNNRFIVASSTIQQAASHVSSLAILNWMGREIPILTDTVQVNSDRRANSVSGFLFQLATSIQPGDLRSLLGRELPGMVTTEDARYVVAGKGATLADFYVEYPPHPRQVIDASQSIPTQPTDTAEPDPHEEKPAPIAKPNTEGKKIVFVYNSHNRESWYSETKAVGSAVDHPTQNISLVSKRLAEALNESGIGADVSTEDIYQQLLNNNLNYALSYAQSLKVLKAATEKNRELHYFFDLHRDTAPRDRTTVTIKGKTYARVMFVIGKMNKNHEKNEAFATELHQLMEKMYPELSRGVMEKGAKTGHAEYNQSISPGSLLMEVGGTENTLQESLNTAEALADVFAAYYLQAEKVGKPVAEEPAKR